MGCYFAFIDKLYLMLHKSIVVNQINLNRKDFFNLQTTCFWNFYLKQDLLKKQIINSKMSIKDRINFWEQKKVADDQKPFPKPIIFHDKKPQIIAPTVMNDRKPQLEINSKPSQTTQPQVQNKQVEVQKVSVQSSKFVQLTPKPFQPQPRSIMHVNKQQANESSSYPQQSVISVKDNISKFNSMKFSILGPVAQSVIIGTFKKSQNQQKSNQNQRQNQIKSQSADLSHSTPLYVVEKDNQHKMSFKEKRQLAEKMFANRAAMNGGAHKKPHEEQNEEKNHQNENQHEAKTNDNQNTNQNELKQDKYHFDGNTTTLKEQNLIKDQSERLFMEALKQQPQKQTHLLGGQMNNLTLETRMTRKIKKKNNDDDFDEM